MTPDKIAYMSVTPDVNGPMPLSWVADLDTVIPQLVKLGYTGIELQTRKRYWEARRENGYALLDRPMEVWSPSWDQPGVRGLLQAYLYENLAREVCQMDDEGRMRWAIDTIELVHPGLAENLEGGVAKCWDEDPWARGAYTLFMPGQLSEGWPELIAKPEGRIYFAGEHASPYPGWMQGALWSAHKAAEAVAAG